MDRKDIAILTCAMLIVIGLLVWSYYCLQMQYDCKALAIIKGYSSSEVMAICK